MSWLRQHRIPIIFLLLFLAAASGGIWLWESGYWGQVAVTEQSQNDAQISALQSIKEENDQLQAELQKLQEHIAALHPAPSASAVHDTAPTASGEPNIAGEQLPGKLDINTADIGQLDALPGIGPAKAQAIVDDRTANGPFKKPSEITRVKGIGEKTFKDIEALIVAN